ncbi:MAG TPA: tetratricopeptide repeat protein [Candidatus Limnocylindria bacterium]|nr:tetratricopeptide repeat protein [Candidatus Limnocylindria bacterium]
MNLRRWPGWLLLLLLAGPAWAHGPLHEQITNVTAELSLRPDDVPLLLRRGELNRLDERWADALADLQRARTLAPENPDPLLGLGRLALDQGKFAEAIPSLQSFVAVRSNHVEGHLLLARALLRTNQETNAAAHFSRALALSAEPRPEWFIERSQAQFAQGEAHLPETLAGLDEGLKRLGPVPTLQLAAIELELRRHNFDAALQRLDTVLAGSERKERWLLRRAEILELAGRPTEAGAAYAAAREAFEALPLRLQRSLGMLDFRQELEAGLAALPPSPKAPPPK